MQCVTLWTAPKADYERTHGYGALWTANGSYPYQPLNEVFNRNWRELVDNLNAAGFVVRMVFDPPVPGLPAESGT
jgi:hypothetical protein